MGARKEIVVALDWTGFERDDHATLCAYVVTTHGRATPLTWKTVKKSTLAGKRNDFEYEVIDRLHSALPTELAVTLVADQAFGDQKLYALLESLGWEFLIRFRSAILIEDDRGTQQPGEARVPASGRATMLRPARVTADRAVVPAVVVVHQALTRRTSATPAGETGSCC